MAEDLISSNVRREAREFLVTWPLGAIEDLFHGHGFSADYSYEPRTSGQRRTLVEQFYVQIDWGDKAQVEQSLGVFEGILDDAEAKESTDAAAAAAGWSERFGRALARDGIERDGIGKLRPRWASLSAPSLDALPAESAIPVLLRRMWDSVEENPDAAIGAAKEAVEATAKHLLLQAGEAISPTETMPSLIARAQKLLDIHPTSVAPTKEGADTIKTILAALSQTALGINGLRKTYGTGHGRPTRPSGLRPRHARLAVQAADGWIRFVLDTEIARRAE